MKLKYYLRGLGIGIIITTLILTVALSGGKEKLSDEEIIQRAEELGMVMAATEETEAVDTEAETEQQNEMAVNTETDTEQQTEIAAEPVVPASTETGIEEPQPQEAEQEISFTVSAGESSDTVAFNLYKAGIIDDATAFNRYMVKNGYDSRLRAGTFQIKTGSSYDDVLDILVQ